MCAVLAEEPVAQDPGYAGEPQTVNLYQCGGSLIAPGVILTAAHCAAKFQQEPTKLKIRCGEWDTQNQTEPRPHQDRYVQNLDIHPEFNPRNLANDWAVLYTSQDFDLQAHIDTICLPQPEELFDFQTCFATGWGKDQFGAAGNYQVVLKEIDLPVVGHDQCEASLRTTRLGKADSVNVGLKVKVLGRVKDSPVIGEVPWVELRVDVQGLDISVLVGPGLCLVLGVPFSTTDLQLGWLLLELGSTVGSSKDDPRGNEGASTLVEVHGLRFSSIAWILSNWLFGKDCTHVGPLSELGLILVEALDPHS